MIEVNNSTSIKINEKKLKEAGRKLLKEEGRNNFDLSVAIVNHSEIKFLNKKYRKKNRSTDTLSFLYGSSGEIVICPQEIINNSKRLNLSFEEELIKVFVHSVLHLFGYDHERSKKEERKMKAKENYFSKLWQREI